MEKKQKTRTIQSVELKDAIVRLHKKSSFPITIKVCEQFLARFIDKSDLKIDFNDQSYYI